MNKEELHIVERVEHFAAAIMAEHTESAFACRYLARLARDLDRDRQELRDRLAALDEGDPCKVLEDIQYALCLDDQESYGADLLAIAEAIRKALS